MLLGRLDPKEDCLFRTGRPVDLLDVGFSGGAIFGKGLFDFCSYVGQNNIVIFDGETPLAVRGVTCGTPIGAGGPGGLPYWGSYLDSICVFDGSRKAIIFSASSFKGEVDQRAIAVDFNFG